MMLTASNPTFVLYVIAVLVLSVLLTFLWAYSGVVRGKTKTAINPEDGARFGAPVVDRDPPEVARVLRAHANAEASIYPFLFLGFVFVCLGGTPRMGTILFGAFTVARIAHAAAYLAGKQPWRTICFIVGGLAMGVLIGDIVSLIVRR
jgi:prostaglandin-E synthase 1